MSQNPGKPVVFITFANAAEQGYLSHLKKESALLRDLFLPLHQKGEIELLREESLDHSELAKLLNQYKGCINIFHYGGHAGGNYLALEDSKGHIQGLAELLGLQTGLKLVFLNGCSTQGQARPYLEAGLPAVIATSKSVSDEDATFFAEYFYHALVNKHTIREAFQSAGGALKARSAVYQTGEKEILTYRGFGARKGKLKELPWRLYVQEGKEEVLDWRLSERLEQQSGTAGNPEKKGWRKKVWPWLVGLGVLLAIPAALSEFTGYNLRDIFNAKAPIASNTVMVKAISQNKNITLPEKGKIYLTYGNAQIGKEINNHNEAIFTEVPNGYFEEGNQIRITFDDPQGEPYYAVREDSIYQLRPNQSIELLVGLRGLDKLYGIVKDFETGDYIEGARVSTLDLETFSNENGWWNLYIKEEGQKRKFYTVRASKEGYYNWEQADIPAQVEREISILLKPK